MSDREAAEAMRETETETLLRCPFCGGEAQVDTYPSAECSYISIAKCIGGEVPKFVTGKAGCGAAIIRSNNIQAIEAWNARALSEPTPDPRDELLRLAREALTAINIRLSGNYTFDELMWAAGLSADRARGAIAAIDQALGGTK